MLAALGEVSAGQRWAFEVKFDGVRAIGYRTRDGLVLFSRNDRHVTATSPEIAGVTLGGPAGDGLVVDGELVALDERGRPDFELLQDRMHLRAPSARWWRRCRCGTWCSTCSSRTGCRCWGYLAGCGVSG